ncbi:type II toxin-antitoxin system HicA family toxin [Curtobacterium sp. S6]|uniref:type II toxin-antitoxin system HicA family toxin n=1 Tax=Curtobacterium sp. S6 TaxID=1479623 RepID=UPI0004AA0E10|nr:type II toxin-antitoxin system HicA family toxin [Curtobacterium sp. S6]
MVKPMKYKELAKRLRAAGFSATSGKGDHEIWRYPGIDRPVVVTRTREVSPAIVRNALQAIEKKQQKES